jgi:hypothetical protein
MPVLMIGDVPNLTEEIYAGMVGQLMPLMQDAEGFISHAGGPSPTGGWRVVEICESEQDGQKWFDENVKPNLPPGIIPDRTDHPLHRLHQVDLTTKSAGDAPLRAARVSAGARHGLPPTCRQADKPNALVVPERELSRADVAGRPVAE